MTSLRVGMFVVVALGALIAGSRGALAETPPVAEMEVRVALGLQLGLPYIAWEPVEGAAHYVLAGEIHMLRVNREDPFCTPPVEEHDRTLTFDDEELISAKVGHADLPGPELPPEDAWFFYDVQVQIEARDEDGVIAAGSQFGIAETGAFIVCPTPPIVLPPTGLGGGGGAPHPLPALAGVLAAAGLAAFAALRGLRKERSRA